MRWLRGLLHDIWGIGGCPRGGCAACWQNVELRTLLAKIEGKS